MPVSEESSDIPYSGARPYIPIRLLVSPRRLSPRTSNCSLTDKKQVIFQGPPGTGKTYVARKRWPNHLAGSEDRVTLVQFHPSYAYEDFRAGFSSRRSWGTGNPGFELKDGPLLRAAERAEAEPSKKHYLIIDEINRGNLAKVFGELYFLLEYRDEEITLQYQRDEDEKKFSSALATSTSSGR